MSSSFEDLDVWKKSCQLTAQLHDLLKDCEDNTFKDQIVRSAISTASSIAEGREQSTTAEFTRFLNKAKGSAAGLRTQVYIAKNTSVFSDDNADMLINEAKIVSKMLQALINALNKPKVKN